ncbi:MAG: hypothetical protein QOJ13_942 [Gaiellales bacterium]|jgi:hypothetical protein|nr:hypothetical protein [Gaiellales bacterium]
MNGSELGQTAEILRRLLAEAESGRLELDGPQDAALLRRVEGAAGALEAAAEEGRGTGAFRPPRRGREARRGPADS